MNKSSNPISESPITSESKSSPEASNMNHELRDYTTTVTILESITDAIFILNASGKIEYANRSAQDYLQSPIESIIGNELGTYFKNDDESWQILSEGIRNGDLNTINNHELFSDSEAELKGEHGSMPVLINFSTIPNNDGNLRYLIVTAKEITYRKSLEKELKNRQSLSVSFDRLKALGEMSVGLVHSLGQPVTSMELRIEHIGQLEDLVVIQEQISELKRDMGQLAGIVKKVRSYAQAMDNRKIQEIDVNQNIQAILKMLEYEISSASVTLELSLADDLPKIDANEPELEQVFINIVTNAIHAFEVSDTGGIRQLKISTRAEENKWIQISFKDNAGGINPKVLPEIFEPFFSTWDKDKHAGTGLSISRSIVTLLGGDLSAKTQNGGAEFILRIPITQSQEREQLINLIELLNS